MSDALQLYTTVLVFLFAVPCTDVRNVYTLAWMVTGLLLSHTINLDEWATRVVSRAQNAASVLCRFHRWFNHPGLQVPPLYAPLIRQALAKWATSGCRSPLIPANSGMSSAWCAWPYSIAAGRSRWPGWW